MGKLGAFGGSAGTSLAGTSSTLAGRGYASEVGKGIWRLARVCAAVDPGKAQSAKKLGCHSYTRSRAPCSAVSFHCAPDVKLGL